VCQEIFVSRRTVQDVQWLRYTVQSPLDTEIYCRDDRHTFSLLAWSYSQFPVFVASECSHLLSPPNTKMQRNESRRVLRDRDDLYTKVRV